MNEFKIYFKKGGTKQMGEYPIMRHMLNAHFEWKGY